MRNRLPTISEIPGCGDREEIEHCLHCEKPYCNNCLDGKHHEDAPFHLVEAATLTRMYNEGALLGRMARAQGMNPAALKQRLTTYGLPTGRKQRPVIGKETFAQLSEGCRKYITWEGETMA